MILGDEQRRDGRDNAASSGRIDSEGDDEVCKDLVVVFLQTSVSPERQLALNFDRIQGFAVETAFCRFAALAKCAAGLRGGRNDRLSGQRSPLQ